MTIGKDKKNHANLPRGDNVGKGLGNFLMKIEARTETSSNGSYSGNFKIIQADE